MMRFLRKILGRSSTTREKWIPPSTSPVAWVGDEVWADWSRRPVRDLQSPPDESDSPIGDPVVGEVSDGDRARAPRRPLRGDERMAPEGLLAEHVRLLRSTPSASIGVYGPFWPVCCRRLTTIIHCQGGGRSLQDVERDVGALDYAFVEGNFADIHLTAEQDAELRLVGYSDLLRVWRREKGGDGYGIFECRSCGRTYVTTWEP